MGSISARGARFFSVCFWYLVSGFWLLGFIPPSNRRVIVGVNPPP
jgi:hypothetical protein